MTLFVTVVEQRSFSAAAKLLDIPGSSLSRRFAAFEKAIGLQLVNRTTRRFDLTDVGRQYFERCRAIVGEAKLAHAELGLRATQPYGCLRISLPPDFGAAMIAPIMARFAAAYPEVNFELDSSPRTIDMAVEQFDMAIRFGDIPDSSLTARRIATVQHGLFASTVFLDHHGMPSGPDALAAYDGLLLRHPRTLEPWPLRRGDAMHALTLRPRCIADSMGMLRSLVLSDLGIGVVPRGLMMADVHAGRARQVLPEWSFPEVPVYAITTTRMLPAKTRRFIEMLTEDLSMLTPGGPSGARRPLPR